MHCLLSKKLYLLSIFRARWVSRLAKIGGICEIALPYDSDVYIYIYMYIFCDPCGTNAVWGHWALPLTSSRKSSISLLVEFQIWVHLSWNKGLSHGWFWLTWHFFITLIVDTGTSRRLMIAWLSVHILSYDAANICKGLPSQPSRDDMRKGWQTLW